MAIFLELFFVLIFLVFISYFFIQIFLRYNYLKEPKALFLNCVILALIYVVSNIGYSNLPLSMSLSALIGPLIGPLIGSFISGSLAIACHFRFKWGHFYKNYLTHISLSMSAPLLLYLSMNTYFTLS